MISVLLTACIIIGLTFLFIFFFSLLHKNGLRNKLAAQRLKFQQTVDTYNLKINKNEEFNKYQIAIDTEKRLLVYFDFSQTEDVVKLINLQTIKHVKVDVEEHSIYEEKKGKSFLVEKQFTKLQLELIPKDEHQPRQFLPFYHLYTDGIHNFSGIKSRLESWQHYINKYLIQTVQSI